MNKIPFILIAFCTFLSVQSLNATVFDHAGEAEFAFLETYQGARAEALGGALSAGANDLDALLINPAGLQKMRGEMGASLNYEKTAFNDSRAILSFGQKIDSLTLALNVDYTRNESIEGLDENGNPTGVTHNPGNLVAGVSTAFSIGQKSNAGITAKLITETLANDPDVQTALGWGFDLGIQSEVITRKLKIGVSALNLGRKERAHIRGGITGGTLNSSLRTGIQYRPTRSGNLVLNSDVEKALYNNWRMRGGVELRLRTLGKGTGLFLRAGGQSEIQQIVAFVQNTSGSSQEVIPDGNLSKFQLGAGLRWKNISIDYALGIMTGGLPLRHILGIRWSK